MARKLHRNRWLEAEEEEEGGGDAEEKQKQKTCAQQTANRKLSKYDSSDCIDIDRLQCGFSAYGKQFQSASAATAAIEKHYRHRLYTILLRVCDYCIYYFNLDFIYYYYSL